jgi:signal transduction histidine kinase
MRAAAGAQQALDVMCSRLGEGLGVDRVIAITLGIRREVHLGAQWHRPDLQRLGDLAGPVDLGELAEELWLSSGFWEEHDLLEPELPPPGAIVALLHDSGARAGVTVPIGLDDRVIGVIHVLTVDSPRVWSRVETDVVKTAAEFVAKAIVGIEHQANHRRYLDRVETLDRQKSDFLATVSHELRTPLTSISGYLELLQGEDAGPLTPQQRRMLEAIDRNTLRLRNLIEDVMLSRIEGGVSEPTFVEVSIRTLITRVSKELIPLADHRSVELEIDAGSPTATVLGDRAALSRAVATVLSNAIKFSHQGGVVTLQGARDPGTDRMLITCQDHGVGIPATDMPDLFTRFFRASNAIRNETQGSGLGLSIAKTIIEDHRGVLRLTSVEGEGTTVVMDLPMYDPSQTQPLRDPHDRVGRPPWFDGAESGVE